MSNLYAHPFLHCPQSQGILPGDRWPGQADRGHVFDEPHQTHTKLKNIKTSQVHLHCKYIRSTTHIKCAKSKHSQQTCSTLQDKTGRATQTSLYCKWQRPNVRAKGCSSQSSRHDTFQRVKANSLSVVIYG